MITWIDIDYETRSFLDVTDVGSAKYSEHESTEILMITLSINIDEEIINWNPFTGDRKDFRRLCQIFRLIKLNPKTYRIRAHHSEFEYWITRNVATRQFKWPVIPIEQFYCTMSLSGANSYPSALAKAGEAMRLPEQKLLAGKALINFFSKPTTKKGEKTFRNPLDYLKKFNQFIDYCNVDRLCQISIVDHCQPLTRQQERVMVLTEKMNVRGIPIDKKMVYGALELVEVYRAKADQRIHELTHGELNSARQTEALTKWLNKKGAKIPNLKAPTLENYLLKPDLNPVIEEAILIRSNISKTSTAKYEKALDYLTCDDKVHGFIKAYLAMTGRWKSFGLQLHNFPKPGKKLRSWYNHSLLCEMIREREFNEIEVIYGDIMEALKAAARGMIYAPTGYTFTSADYSQIEARIVMWVANDPIGLADFREDKKVYELMAAEIFVCNMESIIKGSFERDVGKETVLGCGFGMGEEKFRGQALSNRGLIIPQKISKKAVKAYRARYKRVPEAWKECETAAFRAIRNKGRKFYACGGKYCFYYANDALNNKLPSGRTIKYPEARIGVVQKKWGAQETILYRTWKETAKAGHKWVWADIWGGVFFQHGVQGIAGDVMATGLLNVENEGYNVLLTVHDEGLSLNRVGFGDEDEYIELLCDADEWADGIPLKAEAWTGRRYH